MPQCGPCHGVDVLERHRVATGQQRPDPGRTGECLGGPRTRADTDVAIRVLAGAGPWVRGEHQANRVVLHVRGHHDPPGEPLRLENVRTVHDRGDGIQPVHALDELDQALDIGLPQGRLRAVVKLGEAFVAGQRHPPEPPGLVAALLKAPPVYPNPAAPHFHRFSAHGNHPLDVILPRAIGAREHHDVSPPYPGSHQLPPKKWDGNAIAEIVGQDAVPLFDGGIHGYAGNTIDRQCEFRDRQNHRRHRSQGDHGDQHPFPGAGQGASR